MDDLISRQAAISAICNACGKIDCDKMDKCEKLQLPPANCSEFPNNSDTISRQAAIDAIDKALSRTFIEPCGEMILKDLPSAQPQRMNGKWTNENGADGWNRCSICGELAIDLFDYCPNCGADMRGVQDG